MQRVGKHQVKVHPFTHACVQNARAGYYKLFFMELLVLAVDICMSPFSLLTTDLYDVCQFNLTGLKII